MSFLPTKRQSWEKFCQRHELLIDQLRDLRIAFTSSDRFDELLQRGETSAKAGTERLSALSHEDWRVFEEFMRYYTADRETYFVESRFPTYFREVARRNSQQ